MRQVIMNALRVKPWWVIPLGMFVLWRLALEGIAQIALQTLPHASFLSALPLWARWDSIWYASIVERGYDAAVVGQSNLAFFPLYPLGWKLTTLLGVPFWAAGVLIATLATAGACLIIYRLALERHGAATAQKVLWALLAFPGSFFLVSAYSDALFIFLLAAALYFSQRRSWLAASLAAALAAATRPLGILLWPILIWQWWRSPARNTKQLPWLLVLPPLGLVIFSLYLWQHTGSPLSWLMAQAAWGRTLAWPLAALTHNVLNILMQGPWWLHHLGQLVLLTWLILLLPRVFKLNSGYGLFTTMALATVLMSSTLGSLLRLTLALLPIFFVVGLAPNRLWYTAHLIICWPLLIWAVVLFATGQWVA